MADFITSISGPISTLAAWASKIPGIRAGSSTIVDTLEVTLRTAPTGADAIFEFFKDLTSMGFVTVPAGTTTGTTAIAANTVAVGQIVTVVCNQKGTGPGDAVGATPTFYAREQ